MLSWFVDYFKDLNRLTPDEILVLFIVSVIAVVWAIGTLFLYARAKHSAGFVAFVSLALFPTLSHSLNHFVGLAWVDGDVWMIGK